MGLKVTSWHSQWNWGYRTGSWWWSSGQRTHPLLHWSELEPCWRQGLYSVILKKKLKQMKKRPPWVGAGSQYQTLPHPPAWGDLAKFRHSGMILKYFRPFLVDLFSIWQNCEPTFANVSYFRANFSCSKWPNIEIIRWPSGHNPPHACRPMLAETSGLWLILKIINEIDRKLCLKSWSDWKWHFWHLLLHRKVAAAPATKSLWNFSIPVTTWSSSWTRSTRRGCRATRTSRAKTRTEKPRIQVSADPAPIL